MLQAAQAGLLHLMSHRYLSSRSMLEVNCFSGHFKHDRWVHPYHLSIMSNTGRLGFGYILVKLAATLIIEAMAVSGNDEAMNSLTSLHYGCLHNIAIRPRH